ncbi:hypothetical protein [Rubellimicrobium roseum]|uniref:Uncharacterized protein n=1 Tax=Rubellimicrobium roseum TaxID=687525 RepID=A0A5C4NH23_9RHOB|nr:hypothetical protein [Rubellimicrobium roseum]TNC74124.1 hypothetical protein FHG71_02700 [Rubellimicrobium roseum]
MQITLNKIAFDVKPVGAPLRGALLADPAIKRAALRPVWSWDKAAQKGTYAVDPLPDQSLAMPMGVSVFVAKPGLNGVGPQKADGPTQKMGERILEAVGAKTFGQVMQAVARVTGVPRRKIPFEAFAPLNDKTDYTILLQSDFSVLELANAGRNLSAFVFLPGIVTFAHVTREPVEGALHPGSVRPGYILPPGTQAAMTMRRMAVAKRLMEMQAELGDLKPADLAIDDPRRATVSRLGAEWKVLQPKPAQAA